MYCSYLLLSIFILQVVSLHGKLQLPGVTVHLLHHYSWLSSPPDEGGEGSMLFVPPPSALGWPEEAVVG